ncbi:MAG: hypothetical protein KAW87_00650 [Candidatus Cloacimonetes bacterium]|nr:hypothetical protein [Candidatus Cloacimonadota bacterium]
MKKALIFFIIISLFINLFSQSKYKKEELITITRDISFPEAIKTLEIMAQQFEGKKIINMSVITTPIGIPIKQLYWKDALDLIISFNKLVLEELPGAYLINDFIIEEEIIPEEIEGVTPDTKQIRISSILFKADKYFLSSIGIDWSTLFNGKVVASIDFKGGTMVPSELFQATGTTRLESGKFTIDINTLLRIIESKQRGTVIARPSLIVLSGKKGKIQVGDDFSVKTVDEAGNVTDRFFSTGIIMEVTPTIIEEEGKEAIHLLAKIEKSSAVPGEISTIIHKSQSETEVLLFDGEETVIGGLYDTEVTEVRIGIPILKDLPWWVLGIRYLTGYNKRETNVRELIIILKVEIIEPIDQRKDQLISLQEKIRKMRKSTTHIDTLFNVRNKEKNDNNKKENE